MFETLIVLGVLAGGVMLLFGLLKLLVVVLLLPFKIAFLLAQGLIGLVIAVPVLIITSLVLVGTLPVICFFVLLPLAIVGAAFVGLLHLLFG